MDWKMKLMDELISRTVLMAVLYTIPLFFWNPSPTQAQVYTVLAGMGVGGGYLKTVQNALKAKFEKQVK